jgi:hypothetical protein
MRARSLEKPLRSGPDHQRARHLRVARRQLALLLDLFADDNQRSVYAGEREVRPPGAPTTEAG